MKNRVKVSSGKAATIYIGVRFPLGVATWLRSRAAVERRSVSSLIVLLIEGAERVENGQ